MKFEYYVLNYDFNSRGVVRYNIFNNCKVYEWCLSAVKKYVRSPSKYKHDYFMEDKPPVYGFDALCEEFRSIFMNQFWSRIEYEISVGDAFIPDIRDFHKWVHGVGRCSLTEKVNQENEPYNYLTKLDAFHQIELNIPMIVRECIYQYKKQIKEKKE